MTSYLNRWGTRVVDSEVLGQPCRVFEQRPTHLRQLLEESARYEERIHLVQGAIRMSFTEMAAAADRVADRLRATGLRPGDRIVLLGANSLPWVVTFWACLANDWVLIPANAWWSPEEIAHAAGVAGARLALCDVKRRTRLPEDLPCLDLHSVADLDGPAPAPSPTLTASGKAGEDDPALVLFTSGTTAFPKGATLTHGGLLANLQNLLAVARRLPTAVPEDRPGSITLIALPLFHIGGIQQLLTAIVSGNTLVFTEGRFSPEQVLRTIGTERVTVWSAVPTMVRRVLDVLEADPSAYDVTSLRTLVMGGAPVPDALRSRCAKAFPNVRRGLGVSYGLTEVSGVVATATGPELAGRPGAVGRLLPTVEVRIEEQDDRGVGEVLVRSPGVMRGYWGLDDDPALTPDRWLRTGDLGCLDPDGFLSIIGRSKDIVIRGGENIASVRVEERLLEHPDVAEVAVVGLPHPDFGEELGAAVVLQAGRHPDEEALARFAGETLAYFEVPTAWWFRPDLPRNVMGKIQKPRIAHQWQQRRETLPSPLGAGD